MSTVLMWKHLITQGVSVVCNSRKENYESIALTQLPLQFSLYCFSWKFTIMLCYPDLSLVHIHAWFFLIFTSPHILTIFFSMFSPYKLLFVLSCCKPFLSCFLKHFPYIIHLVISGEYTLWPVSHSHQIFLRC